MTETIDLNRKNISEDKIRNMLREKGLGNLLLDDKTLLESRRSFIPDNNKINKDVWLFGYGSLIWNPVIEIEETIKSSFPFVEYFSNFLVDISNLKF